MPIEIKGYMGHHDITRVSIPENPDEYGQRWIAWWAGLQPAWRLTTNNTMPMKDQNALPQRPSWRKLAISGENGIVLAAVGIAIWSISIANGKAGRLRTKPSGHEVDAALDLSHTQNIGRLIRTRFKGSQFIVVSLKDGMFANANRIFRTRFMDGTSVVQTLGPGDVK